jgi:peptidoglycan hydrolase CwlO-like protein
MTVQVLLSEKTKLSEHLDEFAARVTTLQSERDEQLLHTAHLRESLEQLQQQLRQSQQKVRNTLFLIGSLLSVYMAYVAAE